MRVVIYGAGKGGKILSEFLEESFTGFVDDNEKVSIALGGFDWLLEHKDDEWGLNVLLSMMNPHARCLIAEKLRLHNFKVFSYAHPTCLVARTVKLGPGCCLFPRVTIMPDAILFSDVMINTGCIVEHDNVLERGVYLSPGVVTAGRVTLKEKVWVGVGAMFAPGVTVGENSIIGAGSLVLKDIPPNVVAYGSPAKVIRIVE